MLALRVEATGLDGLGLTRSWGGGFYRRSRGCGPWRQADQEPSIGLALSEASGRRADGADAGAPGAGEGRGLPPRPRSHPCLGPACGRTRATACGAGHRAPEPGKVPEKLCCQQRKQQGLYCENQLQGRKKTGKFLLNASNLLGCVVQ